MQAQYTYTLMSRSSSNYKSLVECISYESKMSVFAHKGSHTKLYIHMPTLVFRKLTLCGIYLRVLCSSSHSAMNSYSRSLAGSHSTHTVAFIFHWPLNSPFNIALSETSLVSKLPVYFGGFGDFYLNMFR